MRPRFALLLLVGSHLLATPASARVADTKHNLSAFGPGTIRAEAESRICIFCHTPHYASQTQGFLWNRADSTATYVPYDSATLQATVDQPTGASKLCLSCHDGTVALGKLLSEPDEVGFVGGARFLPAGASLLGTDLSDDHPISFDYDAALVAQNPELADPESLTGAVRLDPLGQLQCTSCHDPHDEGFGKFLVATMQQSELCVTCHNRTWWATSSHATSLANWDGSPPDPWPHTDYDTVIDNGCQNCHRSHEAASTTWILNYGAEEDNCLVCHNGRVAATDIQSDITKMSHHPVELTADVHAPNEDATLPMTAHVECTDCHDPHAVTDTGAVPPFASGTLRGVSGIDRGGQFVESVTYQYEVCFKCHGEFSTTNLPITRQLSQYDKRLQFELRNPSYHPIEGLGKNTDVPSLRPPYTEASLIHCTDCHASDRGPGAGGSGAAGPHGSIHPFLLERQYNMLDGVAYNPILYDLCFKCHSVNSILGDESFEEHSKHIEDENAPCSVCHDSHGISATQGNPKNNSHLINFDVSVVFPVPPGVPNAGRLDFEDLGTFTGACYLLCHGKTHNPEEYLTR